MGHDSSLYETAPSGQGMYDDQYNLQGPEMVQAIPEKRVLNDYGFNFDWTGRGETRQAGACWDIVKVEPCCGSPCNVGEGLYCAGCFFFCGPCVWAKMLAYSNDQHCSVCNHCCALGCLLGIVVGFIYLVQVALMLVAPTFPIFAVFARIAGYFAVPLFTVPGCILRHNLRLKWSVGNAGSWFQDWVMATFFAPCQGCQEIRGMPVSGWDWFAEIRESGFVCYDGDHCCQFVRD